MAAFVTINGNRFEAEAGTPLPRLLRLGHIHADMPCGGKGLCKNCAVLVNGEKRLACQTRVEDGMRVEAPSAELGGVALGRGDAGESRPPRRMYRDFGLSVDIGTTSLCATLLGGGSPHATARKNPQTAFGADVISRIERAMAGEGPAIAHCVRQALNEMAAELAEAEGIKTGDIDAAVVTGNTAMLSLLVGQDVRPLSHAPFRAKRLFGEYVAAGSLGLCLAPDAQLYFPRCIAAYLGADLVTAILASGLCAGGETALLMDVGTNAELALWHKGELLCCSTAAGPAFEGAGISQGMYGAPGAIDHAWLENGAPRYSVIDGKAAKGICGSGIADALALMLELGVIDETGAFQQGDSFSLGGVAVTQADVRKIQLAKGAVRAGLETLLERAGIKKAEVAALYIAGGFGSYLNMESAAAVGLIPGELQGRAFVLGNAGHTGASMLLRDKALVPKAESLARQAKAVALDANPVFTQNYMRYMTFERD